MARTITCPSCSAALSLPDHLTAAATCPRCLARIEPPSEGITAETLPSPAPTPAIKGCPNCGESVQPDWRFCPHCQVRLPRPGESPPEDAIWWKDPVAPQKATPRLDREAETDSSGANIFLIVLYSVIAIGFLPFFFSIVGPVFEVSPVLGFLLVLAFLGPVAAGIIRATAGKKQDRAASVASGLAHGLMAGASVAAITVLVVFAMVMAVIGSLLQTCGGCK
jgi:hypothetical protein